MPPTVAVYGATGFTGRLIAHELAARKVPMVLAGRNRDKLATLAERVDADSVRTAAASIGDPDALARAFSGADVVVNVAGPFARYGEPVLEAALKAGVDYCDTTGEQDWMKRVFEGFDAEARARGVSVVPAVGFDYVPGDLLANVVGTTVAPLEDIVLAYDVENFGMTRGTMRSSLDQMRGGDVVYSDGTWVAAGNGPQRTYVTFPDPVGRQLMAKYPSGEQVTIPRHVDTRNVTLLLSTRTIMPPPVSRAVPLLTPLIGAALRTPLHGRIDAAVEALPEGPEDDARGAVRWTIACFARGADGREARGLVTGPDVYGFTAVAAVDAALHLAAADPGVLSPAMAFDPTAMLGRLSEAGLKYEVVPPPA